MADPHDDLTAIVDEVRRVATLPPAQTLRQRSDRRRRRRAAVTGVGLTVVAVTAGAALLQARAEVGTPTPSIGTAGVAPPSDLPSATTPAGPQDILGGRRQVRIVVPGLAGAALAVGRNDDRVRASTEPGVDDRALWVLRPAGDTVRIVSAAPGGAGEVCMTVVHDAAPGSVRARGCDPTAQAQLFRVEQVADGSYSIFQGRRYVQVVDGTNALVPDLTEALTTTYAFEDRGPSGS
ncbi:RICIN domain-containing protein [Micromonospora sp. 067-2]|uniref:RICIN domain-containing protein n=1 Tax=Micromonospora sp. 067-2 TaxID=2789270 RepID=UPI00397A8E1F